MQTWKVSDKKILVLSDQYIGTTKYEGFVTADKLDESKIYKIPFKYIRSVELDDTRNNLIVNFNQDAYQQVKIVNSELVSSMLEALKKSQHLNSYSYDKDAVFKVIKRPLIAALILSIVFAFSYTSAIALENGESILNHVFIVWLAGLGSSTLVLIYSIVVAIIGLSITLKIRNNHPVHKFRFVNHLIRK